MKKVKLQYFAILRDHRGESTETLETEANSAGELYEELKAKYSFPLSVDRIQVAINEEFAGMDQEIQENDEIVFIPPVAGG